MRAGSLSLVSVRILAQLPMSKKSSGIQTRDPREKAQMWQTLGPSSVLRCLWEEQTSALFTPGTSMFASTRPQESFQSQLHEGLEIIASLPSALL